MTKQTISITDIIEYTFCPRKIYLKKIKKIKEPLTKPMLIGWLRHLILDVFNKNEPAIVSSIQEKLEKNQIVEIYKKRLQEITSEIFQTRFKLIEAYKIDRLEFYKNLLTYLEKDLNLRTETILKTIEQGFLGKFLWRNLKPKYLTEFKLVSPELGLKGRIDRVQFSEEIIPYEIKTRNGIFESDKLQLAGYALLLENEFNKSVNKGVIETLSETHEVKLTQDLKNKVLEIAEQIRQMLNSGKPEKFLSNFKKCKSCSINKQCLETE